MTMEEGQWDNHTELREKGQTQSSSPGPTMGTQAKQSENRKTKAKKNNFSNRKLQE